MLRLGFQQDIDANKVHGGYDGDQGQIEGILAGDPIGNKTLTLRPKTSLWERLMQHILVLH